MPQIGHRQLKDESCGLYKPNLIPDYPLHIFMAFWKSRVWVSIIYIIYQLTALIGFCGNSWNYNLYEIVTVFQFLGKEI